VAPHIWLLLAGAAALAGALRWPLASGSLWWDEAWSVRNTVVGRLDPDGAGEALRFRPVSWQETLWSYRTPTNHVAYSVAARLSHAGWRAATGAERHEFHEVALRLPAWLAACASVVLLGLLVHALGFPRAAPAAALLLAIHPWHIRYGADGRGYSFVVLLTLAGALLLLWALREDRWRAWLGYGASQLLLLWTFPLAVYVPLALGAAGGAAIALGPREWRDRLARFAVANLAAGMAYLQVMAPNLAQAALLERLLGEEAGLDPRWLRQLWVAAATGLHVRMPATRDVWFPTVATLAELRPAVPWVLYGALPALAAAGLARALRRGSGPERAVWLGLCAAPLLLVLHRALDGFFAYPRFAIYTVVPVAALLAVGCDGLLGALSGASRARRALAPLGLAAALAAYQVLVAPLTRVLLRHPHAPAREVAELVSADTGHPKGAVRLGVGHGADVPRVYDPWIETLERAEELADACESGRADGRTVYVFYGYRSLNEKRFPETMALLADPRLFEPVARFDGIESEHVYRVLRYTGAPLPPAPAPGS
jgi:hypothetical protein